MYVHTYVAMSAVCITLSVVLIDTLISAITLSQILLKCTITAKPGNFTTALSVLLWKAHEHTVLSPISLLRQLGEKLEWNCL